MFPRTLGLALLFASAALAAPPTVTTLTPGGGQRGTTATVIGIGTFDSWPVQVWCDTPGVGVKADKVKGKFAVTLAADAPLGVAWLRFHDDAGASALRSFIIGGLPDVAEVEPNDDPKSAQIVALPGTVNGVLAKAGDVDCYRVRLAKGQTLVASLDAHRSLRSPMDAILQLLSPEGEVREQNHDARGLDPELAFTAPADGTYALRLFAFPSAPDSSIRHFGSPACVYRLTLTTEEFVDFATPLAAERDREVELTLHGWNLKAQSAKLGKSADRVGTANPFAILREAHPCFDRPVADKPLSPPFTATAGLEKADTASVVSIAGTAGKAIAVRLDSASLGLALTPVLKVLDSGGKTLLRAEPTAFGGAVEAAFTPPTTGTYKIEVRDLFGSAGPRHVYRLRVTPALPEVEAKVAADRFTVVVGTPLEIPITLTRKHGHTGELIPFASGLPEGVTAEAVVPAKHDPGKVVLKLTATKRFTGGPIKLAVMKKGDDASCSFATAALADFDRMTADLWLTVTEKR